VTVVVTAAPGVVVPTMFVIPAAPVISTKGRNLSVVSLRRTEEGGREPAWRRPIEISRVCSK